MNERFCDEVMAILHAGGWFPGRSAFPSVLPDDYELFPAAQKALEEFGGLDVGTCGPGTDVARCDIQFEPYAAEGLASHVSVTDDGLRLYPLGETSNGHAYLFIDEEGAVYLYFIHLKKIGSFLDEALESLLLGVDPSRRSGPPDTWPLLVELGRARAASNEFGVPPWESTDEGVKAAWNRLIAPANLTALEALNAEAPGMNPVAAEVVRMALDECQRLARNPPEQEEG